MDDAVLSQVLTVIIQKLDALEKEIAHARPTPPQHSVSDLVQALSRGGSGPSSPVVNGAGPPGGTPLPESFPSGPEVLSGFELDVPRGAAAVRPRVAAGQRSELTAVSRPGVEWGTLEIPAGRPYAPAPPPQDVAVDGRQLLRCLGDDMVQVRSEDGRLLGAIPMFPDNVETVYTEQRQEMRVGMLAIRTVVVPYNRGIDPRTIVGFVAAPGLEDGPLTTGAVGRGANLENPDIGRRA